LYLEAGMGAEWPKTFHRETANEEQEVPLLARCDCSLRQTESICEICERAAARLGDLRRLLAPRTIQNLDRPGHRRVVQARR